MDSTVTMTLTEYHELLSNSLDFPVFQDLMCVIGILIIVFLVILIFRSLLGDLFG